MKVGRIVLAGIVFAVISFVIRTIEAILTMNFYLMPEYWPVWSKIMMPGPGAPPAEFYVLSIVFALITGIILAFVFEKIKSSMPAGSAGKGGSYFGAIAFLVAAPTMLTMVLLINLPALLVTYWTLSSFVIYIISGIAIAKIMQ